MYKINDNDKTSTARKNNDCWVDLKESCKVLVSALVLLHKLNIFSGVFFNSPNIVVYMQRENT